MEEKRRYKRFSVHFLDIQGKILFSTNIKVLNISVGGVSFSTDKRLTKGGIYVLRLGRKESILYLEGTILWSKLNKNVPEDRNVVHPYIFGMKFSHSSDTQLREIERFIKENFIDYQRMESFAPVTNGIRIHVRFHINNPDKAIIDCAENYKVKRISQSGMLIESDNVFQIEDRIPMQMTLSKNKAVAFWGRIVTYQAIEDMDPPRYEMGIEFVDMSKTDHRVLREFISSLENKKYSPDL
jgi:PilZ domain-containing protein